MERAARTFSSDLRQLAEMRAFVRDICRRSWGIPPEHEALAQLDLAISEAAANIIRHGYRGEADRPIEIIVDADENRVSIGLYHEGIEFDPASVPPPVFDGSREGGFGLYLMALS